MSTAPVVVIDGKTLTPEQAQVLRAVVQSWLRMTRGELSASTTRLIEINKILGGE